MYIMFGCHTTDRLQQMSYVWLPILIMIQLLMFN